MATLKALNVPMESDTSANGTQQRWQTRVPFAASKSGDNLRRTDTRGSRRSGASKKKDAWWKTKLFAGMYNDVRRRAPFYFSDFRDAWDYRVVPATVYMYFAKYVYRQIHATMFKSVMQAENTIDIGYEFQRHLINPETN